MHLHLGVLSWPKHVGMSQQPLQKNGAERMKKLVIEIPREIASALRIPPEAAKREVLKELALALYARQILPLGKARHLASMTRRDFEDLLGERHIARAYTQEDLDEDIAYGLDQEAS